MNAPRLRPALGALLLALTAVACSSGSGDGGPASGTPTPTPAVSSSAASPSAASPSPSASSPSAAASSPAASVRVSIKEFTFGPDKFTVSPGATVTVVNEDSTAHTLTATGQGGFDSGTIGGGKTATFTAPTAPGSYPFICTLHQFMKGTLTVA
ncbi:MULTISPECIES: cupredoxin domain-containing protein [unclassified Kitasatospora]|uniref:cupredoxin domain-containing protein n=1 Tax=unclassified Kitasatospora TaxID=2633591 RepID=UPI000B07A24D|nr:MULTISPECIES: cupredoxin domain-containing protein [unclassified Kitasatospora]